MIEDSLRNYGAGRSILLDRNGAIIAGNKTAENAGALGMDDVLVVKTNGRQLVAVQRTDLVLDSPKARQLAIADNRAAETSLDWDLETLQSLAGDGVDLAPFWSPEELEAMWPTSAELLTDEDQVPPVPKHPVSKRGDLFLLGAHRLLCGDATLQADVQRLLGGKPADAAWTDPPYNVNYTGATSEKLKIQNDDMSSDAFAQFLGAAMRSLCSAVKMGGSVYVAHADTWGEHFRRAFREADFHLAGCLIWRKNAMVLGHSDYQWRHEPILYGWRKGAPHYWKGGRKQTTIASFDAPAAIPMGDKSWQLQIGDQSFIIRGEKLSVEVVLGDVLDENRPIRNGEHPTIKPVALIERQVVCSTKPKDRVVDLFGGSGSTLIACEKIDRQALVMELEPGYTDVILQRFQEATGKVPTREDGKTPWRKTAPPAKKETALAPA